MKTKKEDILKQENGEALILVNRLKALRKRESKVSKELYNTRTLLQEVCIHNETEIKKDFIEGGYYDRAQYITTLECKICGTILDKKIDIGGFA